MISQQKARVGAIVSPPLPLSKHQRQQPWSIPNAKTIQPRLTQHSQPEPYRISHKRVQKAMRIFLLLLLTLLLPVAYQCLSLREQVALLRREQGRDRERIRELEGRGRSGRDSTSKDVLLEVLEEVSREIVGLADDLRRWKGVEEKVGVVEEEVRQLGMQVASVREAQRNLSEKLEPPSTKVSNNEKKLVNVLNPWEEEGSGDLAEDNLFPAVTVKTVNKVPIEDVQEKTEKSLEVIRNENLRHLKRLEDNTNRKIFNLTKQVEKIERQTASIEDRCSELLENTTDDIRSSMALMDALQDDLTGLWKRVAKVEFNSAQFQASLDILEHDWREDRKDIRNLQSRMTSTQKEAHGQSNRILSVEMLTTNLTLQRCKGDAEISKRHLKVENVELRLSQVNHRIDEWLKRSDNKRKLDENVFRNYREALTTIARRTENVSRELNLLNDEHGSVREDLDKFVQQLPKDCSNQNRNGVTLIQMKTLGPFEVYCDITPKGRPWMVIQRRVNGVENFFRNWSDYRTGFGHLTSEFWLGNEAIHLLTSRTQMKLHVDMWDVHDRYFYAEYEVFKVKSEQEQYALVIANHTGNASDALSHHFGMGFSTFDMDNDASSANCAVHHSGGWWYQHCHRADLNGRYSLGLTWYDELGSDWLQLQRVEMKISPMETYS